MTPFDPMQAVFDLSRVYKHDQQLADRITKLSGLPCARRSISNWRSGICKPTGHHYVALLQAWQELQVVKRAGEGVSC